MSSEYVVMFLTLKIQPVCTVSQSLIVVIVFQSWAICTIRENDSFICK